MKFFRHSLLIILITLVLVSCYRELLPPEATYITFPAHCFSKEMVHYDKPIFICHYLDEVVYVVEENDPDSSLPIDNIYPGFAPFISSILYYDDSIIVFRLKQEYETHDFYAVFEWAETSLPEFFTLPEGFDQYSFVTDRYYDIVLQFNIPNHRQRNIKSFHDVIFDYDEQWINFLKTKDPSSYRCIKESESVLMNHVNHLQKKQINHYVSSKREKLLTQKNIYIKEISTNAYLEIDKLYMYIPKSSPDSRFLFSLQSIAETRDSPLFIGGLNCCAPEVLTNYPVERLSSLIANDQYGAVYEVPDEYNQRFFNIKMVADSSRFGFRMTTRLDSEIENKLSKQLLPLLDYFRPCYTKSENDSLFIFGNPLLENLYKICSRR